MAILNKSSSTQERRVSHLIKTCVFVCDARQICKINFISSGKASGHKIIEPW